MKLKIKIKNKDFMIFRLFIFCVILSLILIGCGMNVAALRFNGSRMPVLNSYGLDSSTHFHFDDPSQVKLFYFTDIFRIPLLNNYSLWFSIGDIIIWIGLAGLIVLTLTFYIGKHKLKDDLSIKLVR